jgi:uncharacterized protein (TIGR03067 family)
MRGKTTSIASALFFLWFIGAPLAAGVGGADALKELQKFQGTWVMVSGERDGKLAADEHVTRSKIIIEGDKGLLVAPNQTAETIIFEIVKLDPTKNVKEMHFIRRSGPSTGKTIVGIYEFEGDDQYKLAFDPTGTLILKEFATKEGTGHVRNTWKRVKP